MNFLISTLWLQKVKIYADAVWSVVSLICVPGLIGVTSYWAIEGSHAANRNLSAASQVSSGIVHAVPGETAVIKPNVAVASGRKVLYRMKLVDVAGKVISVYPEVLANSEETPEFGNILVRLPKKMTKGDYQLYADITYAVNPIRTSLMTVRLAEITIDKDE